MSKFVKLGALALSAIALSCNVSATEQSAKDSLQNSLLSYMAAVKDSSSLTVYSAVEFEGLDPQINCYKPNDYSNYPELDPSLNAEICYEGILSPEDGTKYIAYSESKGYQVVFKDNLINHVIIPVGAEGNFATASSIKLRVSQANKTPNSQTLYCENDYNQAVRCNGAYVVVAAKEQQTDMNQALDSLYASLTQVASTSLGPKLTDAINKAEDAYSKGEGAQLTADKAAIDASSALSKIASAESDLNAKIANNKALAAGASSTAGSALSKSNANSAELSTLSKSVNDNKVAIGTKVDSSYVDTAIANMPEPEVDISAILASIMPQEECGFGYKLVFNRSSSTFECAIQKGTLVAYAKVVGKRGSSPAHMRISKNIEKIDFAVYGFGGHYIWLSEEGKKLLDGKEPLISVSGYYGHPVSIEDDPSTEYIEVKTRYASGKPCWNCQYSFEIEIFNQE